MVLCNELYENDQFLYDFSKKYWYVVCVVVYEMLSLNLIIVIMTDT